MSGNLAQLNGPLFGASMNTTRHQVYLWSSAFPPFTIQLPL